MNYKKQILISLCLCAITTTNQLNGMHRNFYSDDDFDFSEKTPDQPTGTILKTISTFNGIDSTKWDLLMGYLRITNGKELVLVNTQLADNQFKQIIEFLPEQILSTIIFVRLFGNQLTTLPTEITKFRNVKIICADGNPLITLPEEITHLEQLEELMINHTVALPAVLRSDIRIIRR